MPLAAALLCLLAAAEDAPAPPRQSVATAAYTVVCNLERGRPLAPITVGTREGLLALLDAGLQAPVISSQTSAALGFVPSAHQSITLDSLALAPKVEYRGPALLADLAPWTERLGTTIDAIVPLHQPGLEVTLDLAHAQIDYRPLAEALLTSRVDGTGPLVLRNGDTPTIQVLVDGKFMREMVLDLSFAGVASFSQATLEELGMLARNPDAIRTHNGDGGTVVQFRLPGALRLGNTDLDQPICDMAPGPDRLGLGALRHFRLTLNYEAGLARWDSPNGARIAPEALVAYGITLYRLRAGQWELAVTEDSPAAEAGIVPGATLAGIGDTPLRQTGHAATGRLLRATEGDVLDLTVIQQGTPLAVTLVARRLL